MKYDRPSRSYQKPSRLYVSCVLLVEREREREHSLITRTREQLGQMRLQASAAQGPKVSSYEKMIASWKTALEAVRAWRVAQLLVAARSITMCRVCVCAGYGAIEASQLTGPEHRGHY